MFADVRENQHVIPEQLPPTAEMSPPETKPVSLKARKE